MTGNEDSKGFNVAQAPKWKVMFMYYVANDTDDDAMKVYIEEDMCKVQFRCRWKCLMPLYGYLALDVITESSKNLTQYESAEDYVLQLYWI